MKKNLSAIAVALVVTVLATCALGWNCKEKVFAAETGATTNQFEMPIITINTNSGIEVSSDEVYTNAKISTINAQGTYEMTDMSMSIRLRGNASLNAPKKSYKMKFEEKQNILNVGDGKSKVWTLIANYFDTSLLRNLTAYHFADKLTGMTYSPNCRSIELYLNGQYQGVYLLCEAVNVSKNRIAIEEAPDQVESNGYLVEMSRYDGENKFDVDTESYVMQSDLSETASIKEQQITYISNYIKESYNALKNGNKDDVEKYIDLDSLVDIYIGNEIVKNVDAGWDSFYMYKDVNGKLCFGPMWDFDLAMANANCVKGFDSWAGFNPYHILNVNANSNPWFCNALSLGWFRELVKERWNEIQNEIEAIPNTVINEAESNYKSYSRNFEKWDVLGKQTNIAPAEIVALPTFKDHYTYLSNWLSKRINWLTEYYNSQDFINGIFVKEDGKELSANSNLVELSSILAFGCSDYEILPNTGISVSFENDVSSWAQACATGFMLEEGKEYVLSFDYKCNNALPVSFAIQKNYTPWSPYYSGKINMTNELQHFESTFTVSANDSNCALAFSLGGSTNGTVVTLDKMSLVKKDAIPTITPTKAPTNTPTAVPTTSIMYGDVNGDKIVDSADYIILRSYLLRKINTLSNMRAADTNVDGVIDSADYTILRKYLLKIISIIGVK